MAPKAVGYLRFDSDSTVHELAAKQPEVPATTKCGLLTRQGTEVIGPPDCFDCGWVMLAQHGAAEATTDETGIIRTGALGSVILWHLAYRSTSVSNNPTAMCDGRQLSPQAVRHPLTDWHSGAEKLCRQCDVKGRQRGFIPSGFLA